MSKLPRLFDLLPAYLQTRRVSGGLPTGAESSLSRVLGVFDTELAELANEIEQSYDDYFLETCRPELLAYIADLIGYRPALNMQSALKGAKPDEQTARLRQDIAATIGLRRRKGTPQVLADAFTATTNWHSRVIENNRHILATPSIRYGNSAPGTMVPNLHAGGSLTAREAQGRVASVRHVDHHGARGRWHPTDVTVEAWASRAYRLSNATAGKWRHYLTFNPLGLRTWLYWYADAARSVDAADGSVIVSARRIRFSDFSSEAAMRTSLYGPGRAIGIVAREGNRYVDISVDAVRFAPLGDATPQASWWIIDPEQGLVLPPQGRTTAFLSSYSEFGGEIGGWRSSAAGATAPPGGPPRSSIRDRVRRNLTSSGVVTVLLDDNRTYTWTSEREDTPTPIHKLTISASPGCRPVIIVDTADGLLDTGALEGLRLEGVVIRCQAIDAANLGTFEIVDTTVVNVGDDEAMPAPIHCRRAGGTATIERSVVGPIQSAEATSVVLQDSIIHAADGQHALSGLIALKARRATIVGEIDESVRVVAAVDTIHPRMTVGQPRLSRLVYGRDGYCQPDIPHPDSLPLSREPGAFHFVSPALNLHAGIRRIAEYAPMDTHVGVVFRE